MKYSSYEYFDWRASVMRDMGDKLSKHDYELLSNEKRNEMLEYILFVSRKIILETDVFEEVS